MKILLCNPPSLHKTHGQEASFFDGTDTGFYPHIGLLSIASHVLENSQHEVKVVDSFYEQLSKEQVNEIVREFMPDIIGVTVYTHTLYDVYCFIGSVRETNPVVTTVLGGPHLSHYAEETARWKNVNYVISGEGEEVFLDLLEYIDKKKKFDESISISYIDKDKEFVNSSYNIVKNLDKLAPINLDLFDYSKAYCTLGRKNVCASLVTSRGCPHKCVYCYTSNSKYRLRTLGSVIEEIESYLSKGISEFMIWDELFNINTRRVMEFSELVLKNGFEISWSFRGRVNAIDEGMLMLAKKAGCHRIHFGIEVGSNESLKRIRKGINLKKAAEAIKKCKRSGIETVTNWIFGFPFETKKDMEQTLSFAIELDAEYAEFNMLLPFPATEIYQYGISNKLLDGKALSRHVRCPIKDFEFQVFENVLSKQELLDFVDYAYRKYYIRPKYIIKSLFRTRSFFEFKQKAKGGLKVFLSKP